MADERQLREFQVTVRLWSGKTADEVREWFHTKLERDLNSPSMITRPAEVAVAPVSMGEVPRLADLVKINPRQILRATGDEDYRVAIPGLPGVSLAIREPNLDRGLLVQVLLENEGAEHEKTVEPVFVTSLDDEVGDHIVLSGN